VAHGVHVGAWHVLVIFTCAVTTEQRDDLEMNLEMNENKALVLLCDDCTYYNATGLSADLAYVRLANGWLPQVVCLRLFHRSAPGSRR